MPSIPQSLLWISLVVLWLFVLVPMLISKRETVRRTSDVALATRVLNSAAGARLLRRTGPAAGHASDPTWQPEPEDLDDDVDEGNGRVRGGVVIKSRADVEAEADYLDVDVVEEVAGALAAGSAESAPQAAERGTTAPADPDEDGSGAAEPAVAAPPDDGTSDEYEYIEDTSGLEAGDEPPVRLSPNASRRRLYETKTAAAVTARKYRFRKRVVALMASSIVVTALLALTVWSAGWWACATVSAVTLLYLMYLRRQTRIEERLRRRRAQRMARSRLGVENTGDRAFDVVPARLRRPGAVVLEVDDEDPVFEHLDYAASPYSYHLPKAAGQ